MFVGQLSPAGLKLPGAAAPLARVGPEPLDTVELILVCPSLDRACGIARYTYYVAEACRATFKAVHCLTETDAALRQAAATEAPCIVLLQHEYGLFDHNTANAGVETTAGAIRALSAIQALGDRCRVAVIMHSMVLQDHVASAINKQWFAAGIPLFCLSRGGGEAACVNYVEHGVPRLTASAREPRESFRIGAFGLLSDNKDVESVLRLCAGVEAPVHANFASSDPLKAASVLQRMDELGVSGRISFDFLSEDALTTFLQASAVIYLPQHDFEHFATSGSARFAMATGRPVIAPPHRPFHDLASAIYFADLNGAIDEVRRLKANPRRAERQLAAAERYGAASDFGIVYASLARRLRKNAAWAGGCSDLSLPVQDLPAAKLDIQVAASPSPLTTQELANFRETGMGSLRGVLLRAVPDPRPDGSAAAGSSRSRRAARRLSAKPEGSPAVAAHEACLARDRALTLALEDGTEEAFLLDELERRRDAVILLRQVRMPGARLAVPVFLHLPLYLQLLALISEFEVSVGDAAAYAARNRRSSRPREQPEAARRDLLIANLQTLELLSRHYPLLAQQLVWGLVPSPSRAGASRLIYPASLLTFEGETFVLALYRLILQREPDAPGFQGYARELRLGSSRSMLAHAVADSSEARARDVRLVGDRARWEEAELRLPGDLLVCAALAPFGESLLTDNLAYMARNADAPGLDRLREQGAQV